MDLLWRPAAPAAQPTGRSTIESLFVDLQDSMKSQAAAEALVKLGRSQPEVARILSQRIPRMVRERPNRGLDWVWGNEVYIAGELKMTETIPVLVARIDSRSTNVSVNIGDTENFTYRPALAALISIGTPAISSLAGVLAHGNVLQRQEAAYALAHIGTPNARQALEAALARETDPAVREYVQNGLNPPKPAGNWTPPKP